MNNITGDQDGVSKRDFIRYWLIIQALMAEKEAGSGRKEIRKKHRK